MASEVTSFIEEANEEEILERYDNGEDDEWPEETDESESSFSIAPYPGCKNIRGNRVSRLAESCRGTSTFRTQAT